jgi:3-methyladenine DNA glycosylase AlkC
MAEPMKNRFGAAIPKTIGGMVAAVYPAFPLRAFLAEALRGYADLELMARGRHIARALAQHLPADYPQAVEILVASLGHRLVHTENPGMAPFLYLPHVLFVAEFGLEHFELSMGAQYELTQRFTAEFSIRPFLERYPQPTLERLRAWASDPSPHVRRLVSEGTRPRLPWAPRLRVFQRDPQPVLALLELLKDDPVLYVRRSVANNLNDIGKDHPRLLVQTARRWARGASPERQWIIRHALRAAVKRADNAALATLGFGRPAQVSPRRVRIAPGRVRGGGAVTVDFDLVNRSARTQRVLVDLRVHFVKASGDTRPKVFKLKTAEIVPRQAVSFSKRISLAAMTTRRHFPGMHQVDVVINGLPRRLGRFRLEGHGKMR